MIIIVEIELLRNGGDKEYSMVIAPVWVKFDRDGNVTVKGKIVPDSKTTENKTCL